MFHNRTKLIILGIVAISVSAASLYVKMSVDDTFIFLQFARNMLEGRGMSFNPGEQTYGFTSVSWVLLLYLSGFFSGNLFLNAKLMSMFFATASILEFYIFLKRLIADNRYVLLGTFAWAINPVLLTAYFSGMETALAVFLVLAALIFELEERSRKTALIWSPVIYALCYLTRPEMILLAALGFCDFAMFSPRQRKARRLLWFVLVFAVMVGSWLIIAEFQFGSIVPNPVLIKAAHSAKIYAFNYTLMRLILMMLSTNALDLFLVAGICCLLLLSRRSLSSFLFNSFERKTFLCISILWCSGFLFSYVVQRVEVSPRYLLIISPLLTVFAVLLLNHVVGTRAEFVKRESIIMMCVGFMYLIQSVGATAMIYYPHAQSYNRKDTVLKGIADWMKIHTARTASIATIDIGILGYFSERRIIDVTGLINPDIIKGPTIRYLASEKAQFFLDRNPTPEDLKNHNPNALRVDYEPVFFVSTPSSGLKYGYVEDQDIGFTLYRMHWK